MSCSCKGIRNTDGRLETGRVDGDPPLRYRTQNQRVVAGPAGLRSLPSGRVSLAATIAGLAFSAAGAMSACVTGSVQSEGAGGAGGTVGSMGGASGSRGGGGGQSTGGGTAGASAGSSGVAGSGGMADASGAAGTAGGAGSSSAGTNGAAGAAGSGAGTGGSTGGASGGRGGSGGGTARSGGRDRPRGCCGVSDGRYRGRRRASGGASARRVRDPEAVRQQLPTERERQQQRGLLLRRTRRKRESTHHEAVWWRFQRHLQRQAPHRRCSGTLLVFGRHIGYGGARLLHRRPADNSQRRGAEQQPPSGARRVQVHPPETDSQFALPFTVPVEVRPGTAATTASISSP